MAILAAIFGLLGRFAGRVLTTSLGWASTLLFGRVPADRQVILAALTFGSVAWIAFLVGVILPPAGSLLIANVPSPSWIEESWIRLAMLAGAILLPPVIGGAALLLVAPERRPRGAAIVAQLLRGYPLALGLALSLVWLAVVGIVRKVSALAQRKSDAHIPIVVRPGGYDKVVTDLEAAVDDVDLDTVRQALPAVQAVPARLLAWIAGPTVRSLLPDEFVRLVARDVSISVYPSDIALLGTKDALARARAAIASRLVATAAHLTTSAESQKVEDRLERVARSPRRTDSAGRPGLDPHAAAELAEIDRALEALTVPSEEWEVLYRLRLQVERDVLAGREVGSPPRRRRETDTVTRGAQRGVATAIADRDRDGAAQTGPVSTAVGLAALAMVALDLVLGVFERLRPPRRD